MATAATKFRIDVSVHNLLKDSTAKKPSPVAPKGLSLPTPVFPQYPHKLKDPGPERHTKETEIGVQCPSTGRCADGCFRICDLARSPGTFTRSPLIYSWNTSATWTAGIAGPSTIA